MARRVRLTEDALLSALDPLYARLPRWLQRSFTVHAFDAAIFALEDVLRERLQARGYDVSSFKLIEWECAWEPRPTSSHAPDDAGEPLTEEAVTAAFRAVWARMEPHWREAWSEAIIDATVYAETWARGILAARGFATASFNQADWPQDW